MKKALVILLLFLLPVIIPFIQPGFFSSDDGEWMVIRLSAFHETLKTGQFPVRFLERLNHGLGYPVTNFLYPLPFYIGEAIHLLGPGFIDTTKILLAGGMIAGAVGTFLLVRSRWGNLSAFFAGVMYTFHPYHVFDLFSRGSLGEITALGIFPYILLFINRPLISGGFWAALICSHNTLALIFSPIVIIYGLFSQTSVKKLIFSTAIAVGLSAFFWIPALFELPFTKAIHLSISDFQTYFLNLNLVGFASPILLLAFFVNRSRWTFLAIGLSLCSLFLASPLSTVFWQTLPLPKIVQFPWRFLAILVFSESLLIAILAKHQKNLAGVLVVATMLMSLWSFQYHPLPRDDAYYYTNDDSTTVKNEYSSTWLKETNPALPGHTRIPKMYFHGVKLLVDTKETEFNFTNSGLIEAVLSPGPHSIRTEYTQTPVQMVANTISLMSFVGVLIVFVSQNLRGNFVHKKLPTRK